MRTKFIVPLFALLVPVAFLAACNDYDAPPAAYPASPASTDIAPLAPNDPNAPQQPQQQADDAYPDDDPAALTDFKPTLDPHGTWVDDATYGTVWVPAPAEVGPDFQPYVTSGHWVYGDDYVWVSDYDWGWAPFHYGRWVYVDGSGWAWVPGRVYAGAWVSWRTGYDGYGYVGWGPMAPYWGWRHGGVYRYGVVPVTPYVFVAHGEIFEPHVGAHVVVGERVGIIAAHTHEYASPGVHVGVGVRIAGPAPAHLGYDAARVPHPSAAQPGVARAQQFARPSTAQPMGAHAPTTTTRSRTTGAPPARSGGTRPSGGAGRGGGHGGGGGGHHR